MYAAIEDPNNQADLYTSGSETYAQIQPPASNNQMTVSVEINTSPPPPTPTIETAPPAPITASGQSTTAVAVNGSANTPIPPSIDSLKSQTLHSRQASASSCTSSLGYIGSPKPEKRQANSPLPPTPKTTQKSSSTNVSSSTLTSGRNSSASVIEVSGIVGIGKIDGSSSTSPQKGAAAVKKSPSKDIEEMYAKVMKKTKLFSTPSNANSINDLQNNNPEMFVSDPDIAKEIPLQETAAASPGRNSTTSAQSDNNYETIDKKRHRSSSFTNKDPGYETIPAVVKIRDGPKESTSAKSRMSAPASSLEAGYETLPDNRTTADPGYETLKRDSDYDPNYEVLRPNSDDGYAKIQENSIMHRLQNTDGYCSLKSVRKSRNETNDLGVYPLDGHGYARIAEKLNNNIEDDGSDIYSSIKDPSNTIQENGKVILSKLSECSSLTGSDTDPNYESVRYLSISAKKNSENPYERLQSDTSPGPEIAAIEKKDAVTDYFQVWDGLKAELFKEWLA